MSERITKEKVTARIAELKEAEHQAALQLHAIRVAIAELQALIAPPPIITHGTEDTS